MSQFASNLKYLRYSPIHQKKWLTPAQLKQFQSQLIVSSTHGSISIWNTAIRALTESRQPENSLSLFKQMIKYNLSPDNYTLSFVLRSCSEYNVICGFMCHALAIKLGWDSYDYVRNGLIHFYACCDFPHSAKEVFDSCDERDVISWTGVINGYFKIGEFALSRQLFDEMPDKNAVSWSVMINGYARIEMFEEALQMFNDMLVAGIRPNHSSVVGALSSCASLGAVDRGKFIHAFIDWKCMEIDGILGTALVDMYAKCGCIASSWRIFKAMPFRDVFAYTALISGLADHGKSRSALELFTRMVVDGIRPNEVTFICILSACARIGAVKEGLRIFRSMEDVYAVVPGPKHYGCLVDLLSRAGLLEYAEKVVRRMPVEPDMYVLGALLNACRVHGNIDMGKVMVDVFGERHIDHSGVYVLLSNIYAVLDKWDDVEKVRNGMEEKRVKKVTGCSLLDVDGGVSQFVAGDRSCIHMGDKTKKYPGRDQFDYEKKPLGIRTAFEDAFHKMYGLPSNVEALPCQQMVGIGQHCTAGMFVDTLHSLHINTSNKADCVLGFSVPEKKHCYCHLLVLLVNVWAYHSARVYIDPHSGVMKEQHPIEQRKGFMWAKYFNLTLLKSMDEDLAEAADDYDYPYEKWLWPLTGEVYWQGIYEKEREERYRVKMDKKRKLKEKLLDQLKHGYKQKSLGAR